MHTRCITRDNSKTIDNTIYMY